MTTPHHLPPTCICDAILTMPIYSQMSVSRLAGLRTLLFASSSTSNILLRCIVAEYTKKPLTTWADKLKNRYSSNKNEQVCYIYIINKSFYVFLISRLKVQKNPV